MALASGALLLIAMVACPAASAPLALSPSDRAALTRIRNAQDKAELTLLVAGAGASDPEVTCVCEPLNGSSRVREAGPLFISHHACVVGGSLAWRMDSTLEASLHTTRCPLPSQVLRVLRKCATRTTGARCVALTNYANNCTRVRSAVFLRQC